MSLTELALTAEEEALLKKRFAEAPDDSEDDAPEGTTPLRSAPLSTDSRPVSAVAESGDAALQSVGISLPPEELLPTVWDQELGRVEELRRDARVRDRRLSQVEEYVARIETSLAATPVSNQGALEVLDDEINTLFAQLEEEIEWGSESSEVAAAVSLAIPAEARPGVRAALVRTFNHYDSDHDGALTAEEFATYVSETFPARMASHARALFALVDANGDGVVSLEEFLSVYLAPSS